jgi:hypothetical protein
MKVNKTLEISKLHNVKTEENLWQTHLPFRTKYVVKLLKFKRVNKYTI